MNEYHLAISVFSVMKNETRPQTSPECSPLILPIKGCCSSKQLFKHQTVSTAVDGVQGGGQRRLNAWRHWHGNSDARWYNNCIPPTLWRRRHSQNSSGRIEHNSEISHIYLSSYAILWLACVPSLCWMHIMLNGNITSACLPIHMFDPSNQPPCVSDAWHSGRGVSAVEGARGFHFDSYWGT